MKFALFAVLASGASAVKLENEYRVWHSVAPPPPIWSVVGRGAHDVQDKYVEMAMKSNEANAGEWPVAPAPELDVDKIIPKKPHWAKQDWESVVKKGNAAFSDDQVAYAESKKKEPILISGEPVKATG